MRRFGLALLGLVVVLAIAAPVLAPNPPDLRFPDLLYAPPTRVYVYREGPRAPYMYPPRLVSRIERTFEEGRERAVPLRWFSDGVLVSGDASRGAPLLLLGTDSFGRDIFSRLVHGARVTLALAGSAAAGALILGTFIGAIAGYKGGALDDVLSRSSEFILVLPAMYVALALRAAMPLVLSTSQVFALLTAIFSLLGWPVVSRGVRAVIASERTREHALAATALGMGATRLLFRHLLPAARGHLATQATLLLPAFVLAEATMSYVGLGFPETTPTWGTMLLDAANVSLLADAPWMLAPAAAIFFVVLAVNLALAPGSAGARPEVVGRSDPRHSGH